MPIDIDGYAVLGAIAGRPDAFPAIAGEVAKAARGLVVKQLKDKDPAIEGLRTVATAVGREAFDLIVDALTEAEVKALLGKFDKLNTAIKTAAAPAQRQLLVDLATGAAVPATKAAPVKAAKAPKPEKEAKPPVERAGNSRAMKAKRKV